MASSMYFEPADKFFLCRIYGQRGTLWKISMKSPVYTEVSKPINNRLDYQDCDFNLYYSPTHRKLFLCTGQDTEQSYARYKDLLHQYASSQRDRYPSVGG